MVGEDAVIIVDRAQERRELALQRRDVEAGAKVPEQVSAIFGGRGSGDRQADQRIAAFDRPGPEIGLGQEDLSRRRRGGSERGDAACGR
jgi:hypothetical protein